MIRTLTMIAVAGFLLAAVCLSIAVGMAGPEVVERGVWSWSGDSFNYNWRPGHGVSWESRSSGDGASRTFPWANGSRLEIDLPADVRFTQSDGPASVVVHGPQEALDHVVVNNGRIAFDRPSYDADNLTIEVKAPKITDFALNGSGKLAIADYRQDSLAIRLAGDGDVTVAGKATASQVEISGSGNADLGALALDRAEVRISGSGHAKVGPKSFAKLDISGSGDIELVGHPKRLETHVSGSGEINQDDGDTGGDMGGKTGADADAAPPPATPVRPART